MKFIDIRKYLAKCSYGNNDLSQAEVDFWNFGNFAISPENQVAFLKTFMKRSCLFLRELLVLLKK